MSDLIGGLLFHKFFYRFRMLHGDSKSQNSDYGSFCNTPCDTFTPVGGSTSGPGGSFQTPASSDQQHRGHQRNDSEIQIGNVSHKS